MSGVGQRERRQGRPTTGTQLHPWRRWGDAPVGCATRSRRIWIAAGCGDSGAWAALVEAHAAELWLWAVDGTADVQQARRVSEMVWLRCAQALVRPVPAPRTLLRELARQEAARERARVESSTSRRERQEDDTLSAC